MLLEDPILLQANNWYVAWSRVSGPSSDCGSGGLPSVTTDDQYVMKSNKGFLFVQHFDVCTISFIYISDIIKDILSPNLFTLFNLHLSFQFIFSF